MRGDSLGGEVITFLGGKLNPIKGVCFEHSHFVSPFPIPPLVATKLEAIQGKFLCSSFVGVFKYHLLRWNIVKLPMPEGGLGFRDLEIFNEARLG